MLDWACEQEATSTQKAVLVCLARYADCETLKAWPSVATIMSDTGLKSERAVQGALVALRASGKIKYAEVVQRIDRRTGSIKEEPRRLRGEDGNPTTVVYKLQFDWATIEARKARKAAKRGTEGPAANAGHDGESPASTAGLDTESPAFRAEGPAANAGYLTSRSFSEEEEETRPKSEAKGEGERQPVNDPLLVKIAERLFAITESELTDKHRKAFEGSATKLSDPDVELIARHREANPRSFLREFLAFLRGQGQQLLKAQNLERAQRHETPVKTSSDAKPRRPMEPWQIEKDIKALRGQAKAIKDNKANYDWSGDGKVLLPDAEVKLGELKRKCEELKAQLPSEAELNDGLPA